MSIVYPNPQDAAQRNLAQRIERYFKSATGLTGNQAANLAEAVRSLQSGQYPTGEDAMMLAEKDWPPRFPQPDVEAKPLAELVADFERVKTQAGGE